MWKTAWPKSMPADQYETALMLARLMRSALHKPEKQPKQRSAAAQLSLVPGGGLLTPAEAAAFLKTKVWNVYHAIQIGRLRATSSTGKKTGRKRIARADLEAYAAESAQAEGA
jgi:excisionase family DNA binding protein